MPEENHLAPDGEQDAVVQAHNLTKRFDDLVAVDDVTFEIPAGTIFGFIGPSGCGKTTTVRLLTGIYRPTSGSARVLGEFPQRFDKRDREKIGYMPQLFALYPDLTIWENLNFAASIYGVTFNRSKRLNELLEFVELAEYKDKLVRRISGGMQRRLSLTASLVHQPKLLFLDEPTGGIDPVLRRKFWDYFQALKAQGDTLFVTTQYVGEAAYCDKVGVMVAGRLLMVDTPEGLRRAAFGGDVVAIETASRITDTSLAQLGEKGFVLGAIERTGPHSVRIVVTEAATAMPALLEWCSAHDLEVQSMEEYLPPFDDVFVKIVETERANHE